MIPVTRNQAVYVDWIGVATTAQIRVNILLELPNGKITRYERVFSLTAARTQQIDLIPLTSGKVISISVKDDAFNLEWADAHIAFGIAGTTLASTGRLTNNLTQLGSGFISRTNSVSWPTGTNNPALNNQGRIFSQAVTVPPAGSEFTHTLPSSSRFIIHMLKFTYTTDATVANRRPRIRLTHSANLLMLYPVENVIPASTARQHNFIPKIDSQALVDNVKAQSWPTPLLPESTILSTSTLLMETGDQYSDIILLLEEFLVR